MCEEYHPRSCKVTGTRLAKKDFVIHADLSIGHKDTEVIYPFGHYFVRPWSYSIKLYEHADIPICAGENSYRGRCNKETQWQTETKMRCSCDPDCYEILMTVVQITLSTVVLRNQWQR